MDLQWKVMHVISFKEELLVMAGWVRKEEKVIHSMIPGVTSLQETKKKDAMLSRLLFQANFVLLFLFFPLDLILTSDCLQET